MPVYENSSIWFDKGGFVKTPDGKIGQYVYDTDNPKHVESLQFMADNNKQPLYLIREFIAVDADYRDEHPKKVDPKDWFVLKLDPKL